MEDFDDLICLDEEGESLESKTNGNLSKIKQQTCRSRLQSKSRVNYHKSHDNIVRDRFPNDKQISPTNCCHEKTSNVAQSDSHGRARCSRREKMEKTDELTLDANLLEVDSCEGDDVDYSESGKEPDLDQLSEKGENRVYVNHTNLKSSLTLQIYGDDEDWPYLSGDVDEEAVRLAASLDPNAFEETRDGPQQDSRKKQDATEKMTDKWNSKQHVDNNGSSHHNKTPDKLDGLKRPPRKFSPFSLSGKERRPVVHAHHEASNHITDREYPRYRRQELMKCHEFPRRRGRVERISIFMSSQNRRKSEQTRAELPLLYSKKTYVPYPSPCRKEETASNLPKRSSVVNGVVIKRSYQITSQSLDNAAKKGRKANSIHRMGHKVDSDVVRMLSPIKSVALPKVGTEKVFVQDKVEVGDKSVQFSREKTEHKEIPKKKLRWILTTEQFRLDEMRTNSAEREGRSISEAVAGHQITTITKRRQETPKGNPIKLRLPSLSIT